MAALTPWAGPVQAGHSLTPRLAAVQGLLGALHPRRRPALRFAILQGSQAPSHDGWCSGSVLARPASCLGQSHP